MAFESNIFIDVLLTLMSRSLVFSSSYLNFEDFLCYLIPSLSEVPFKLRGGGITFPPRFLSSTELMTFSGVV